jgi:hypothetical protein
MTITDFLKYVLSDVSGCPTATAKQAVLDAATEFLTYTGAWNEIQDPITLLTNVSEYDLEAPTGARCIDILAVYSSFSPSGELIPVTMEQLARDIPNWNTAEGNLPSHYTRAFDFRAIRVFPLPTDPGAATLRMHAVFTLKDTATTIPDDIVWRYREQIASGAKARLMIMSKVPWRDLESAAIHSGIFDSGKLAAKVTAAHGKTRGAIFVPPRVFGQ